MCTFNLLVVFCILVESIPDKVTSNSQYTLLQEFFSILMGELFTRYVKIFLPISHFSRINFWIFSLPVLYLLFWRHLDVGAQINDKIWKFSLLYFSLLIRTPWTERNSTLIFLSTFVQFQSSRKHKVMYRKFR